MASKPVEGSGACGKSVAGTPADGDGGVGAAGSGAEDEDEELSPAQLLQKRLRDALSANAIRVIDLFKEWDENGDGKISLNEFARALPLLGLHADEFAAKRLFASFDADNTGEIEMRELQQALHAGRDGPLAPSHKGQQGQDATAAAAAAGGPSSSSRYARKSRLRKTDRPLKRVDSAIVKAFAEAEPEAADSDDEAEPHPLAGSKVIARLRGVLAKLGTRVIDVFKQWDLNSDGVVSREEFQQAIRLEQMPTP